MTVRNLIFVSHATPEDNTFTIWLSIRLKLLGYEVWSDVTKLFGGEKWWGEIEQAIDQYTCKFVLVITKTSLEKPGVKREIELALAAEEKHNLTNFIIPIIIDDSPFTGQPYDLSDRNIIPFYSGWATGLSALKKRIALDHVPVGEISNDLGKSLSNLSCPKIRIDRQDDLVLSNQLSIVSAPEHLNFYRLPIESAKFFETFSSAPFYWFEWGGMLASFATSKELKRFLPMHFVIAEAPLLDLKAVLDRRPRNHQGFLRREVIKKMNYLLTAAWHGQLAESGMCQYVLANEKVSWFFPDSEKYGGLKSFPDIFGEIRKKQIIGYSNKNSVYWHYAIEPKVHWGNTPRISLIPHVVFTEDGKTPISDKAKMHRLRRGFCKNWWNFRWRDLLLVYMELMSQGKPIVEIPLCDNKVFLCESRPQIYKSNYMLTIAEQPSGDNVKEEFEDVEVHD